MFSLQDYAGHALILYSDYPIPDFLRMNTFEVKVNVMVQYFSTSEVKKLC